MKSTFALICGGIGAALVGYAVYFDYKRRNDPEFRKSLSTWFLSESASESIWLINLWIEIIIVEKKKMEALRVKEAEKKSEEERLSKFLTSALQIVSSVKYPTKVEEREKFFLDNAQQGEDLLRTGIQPHISFISCLIVYCVSNLFMYLWVSEK